MRPLILTKLIQTYTHLSCLSIISFYVSQRYLGLGDSFSSSIVRPHRSHSFECFVALQFIVLKNIASTSSKALDDLSSVRNESLLLLLLQWKGVTDLFNVTLASNLSLWRGRNEYKAWERSKKTHNTSSLSLSHSLSLSLSLSLTLTLSLSHPLTLTLSLSLSISFTTPHSIVYSYFSLTH